MLSVKTLARWNYGALICVAAFSIPIHSKAADGPSAPGSSNEVVVLSVKGTVTYVRTGERGINTIKTNQQVVLRAGDRLETRANSRATLQWYGGVVLQVSELSQIPIPPPPAEKKRTVLEVLKGFIYIFHRGKKDEFEVHTPTSSAIVLGTEFSVRVDEEGRTVLALFDGEVEISNPSGQVLLKSGEQGVVEPGQAPRRTPIVETINDLIQWFLYYPGVLDTEEAGFNEQEQQVLAQSLAAYRSGDFAGALETYPGDRPLASDADKIYFAALLLGVGQVDKAEALLQKLTPEAERPAMLARALRQLIAAVKGRTDPSTLNPLPRDGGGQLSTALMAESYHQQSHARLDEAYQAATNAVRQSPRFGYAWARVAELEFSFGRTRRAVAALDRALELSPRNAQALALKGFLLSAENRISEAIHFFDKSIAVDGGLGNAWLGRGLCRIRQGHVQEGQRDLQVAAALEPQRALFRSYLGKAFAESRDAERAHHEFSLAKDLDARDPTAWLYSALLNQQNNRVNEAVRDLEKSQELNDNRRLYRSEFLLDQDRAVRGANLAAIYRDAGMSDVSVREAARAANADYANYSAHLFLADSFNELRDPRQINLRYETPWLSEYLVGNLLAPAGSGTLSPFVTQQEYSRLFERNRFGFSSATEYLSRGDWLQSAVQYGTHNNFSYAAEVAYRSENGQRANNELEQLTTNLKLKYDLTAADSVFLQATYYDATSGDVNQYDDPAEANPDLRVKEQQEPFLLAGYRHHWKPGSDTLFLAGYIRDTFEVVNPQQRLVVATICPPAFPFCTAGEITEASVVHLDQDYRNDVEQYSAELQHIARWHRHTMIFGGRYQGGEFEVLNQHTAIAGMTAPFDPADFNTSTKRFHTDFERLNAYAYYHLQLADPLLLIGGVSYDYLNFPDNFRYAPVSENEESDSRWSPKAGLIYTPWRYTTFRAAYSQWLGGVAFDQSFRLEPSQVAGFNQAYRSLIPESVAGASSGEEFETVGVAVDQKLPSQTYIGLTAEWSKSDVEREFGDYENRPSTGVAFPPFIFPADTEQTLDYEERTLTVAVNQLLGDDWALGARYRLSEAELLSNFRQIPPDTAVGFSTRQDLEATLHQVDLFAIYAHASGFFAQANALWSAQSNRGYEPDIPGDDFWQFNVFAGYRFPRRQAEMRLGLLNITDQDYRLNPLNLTAELPRDRTLTVSLKFNF